MNLFRCCLEVILAPLIKIPVLELLIPVLFVKVLFVEKNSKAIIRATCYSVLTLICYYLQMKNKEQQSGLN